MMKCHVPPHDEVPPPHSEVPLPHGEVPPPHNGICSVPNAGSFDTNPPPYTHYDGPQRYTVCDDSTQTKASFFATYITLR